MDNGEKKNNGFTWRVAVVFLFIFAMGMLFGKVVNFSNIKSIEGYLFNLSNVIESNALADATASNATDCNATSSNATDCNATSENATDCNATSSNATDCNATSSNAQTDNGEIYLDSIKFKSNSVAVGDKLYLDISTSGDTLESVIIALWNESTGTIIQTQIKDLNNNPYIIIPSNAAITTYTIYDVMLQARTESGVVFGKYYSAIPSLGAEVLNFGNSKIEVKQKLDISNTTEPVKEEIALNLNSIKFISDSVKVGENAKLAIDCNKKLISAKLTFKSTSSEDTFTVYAKSLNSETYITVPTGTKSLEYKLSAIVLEAENVTKIFGVDTSVSGVEKLNFDIKIKVEENTDATILEYNNENITDKVLSDISKSKATSIVINADGKTIVSKALFNTLKGKEKDLIIKYKGNELVFCGKEIVNAKDIDVSVNVYDTTNEEVKETIGSMINKGIVIDYKSNGYLPGKALARIKATDIIKNNIGNNNVCVYYYNETSNKFELIAENISLTEDEYYEFNISHNSKYVLVNGELDSSIVCEATEDGNVVSFVQGNATYLLLVVLAVVVIITVVIILVINKKKHNSIEM